jgi:hypothetical protein
MGWNTEEWRIDFGQEWILLSRNSDQNPSVANVVFSRYSGSYFPYGKAAGA